MSNAPLTALPLPLHVVCACRWNITDMINYILYFVTFAIRKTGSGADGVCTVSDENERIVKGLYGINVIFVYLRFFRYFAVFPSLGPKLVILSQLIWALILYLMILMVFLVSYGIFVQTIVNPHAPLTTTAAFSVFYKPYYQVYGELMLDDLSEEMDCVGQTLPFTQCAHKMDWLVPFVTGIYLIITSIMIMNLMIADFTTTFENISENSEKVYRMQMFGLLEEYEKKPVWPAPLNVFELSWRILKKMRSYLPVWSNEENIDAGASLSESERQVIVEQFQNINADRYIQEMKKKEAPVDARTKRIEAKLKNAEAEIQFFKGRSFAASKLKERGNRSADDVVGLSIGNFVPEAGTEEPLRFLSHYASEAGTEEEKKPLRFLSRSSYLRE